MRLLLLSTPVGPLGSGLGGGIELTVINLARVLSQRGHSVTIAAPAGSVLPDDSRAKLVQIPGDWQLTAQTQVRSAPVAIGPVLANIWAYARQVQAAYDLLVNVAYDWLPFYLTPFFDRPVAHFVSMGSLNDAMDEAIAHLSAQFPGTLGAYTRAQTDTFAHLPADRWRILGSALNLSQYDYCDRPDAALAWVGRISPEKGLEDAIVAAATARLPLRIFGKLEDSTYWHRLEKLIDAAPVPVEYCGFLPTAELQKALGQSHALLMTPRWVEAFGIVAIEALACGTPVIAYRRGGPIEIVRSGETGWLVEPDSVAGLVGAIARIDRLDRYRCRQQAEELYSLAAWGDRVEQWFCKVISGMISS